MNKKAENYLAKCGIVLNGNETAAQLHILEKFATYADPRGITMQAAPTPHDIAIFASPKGKTTHIACPAIFAGKEGWIVNLATPNKASKGNKTLHFYSKDEASCRPNGDVAFKKHTPKPAVVPSTEQSED